MMELIIRYSNVGDYIMDLFLGTGTTAVAAIHSERKIIGYDMDEKCADCTMDQLIIQAKD